MKKVRFVFTIKLEGNMETQPTPPIYVLPLGPEAFTIEGINVYQGEEGEELLTKFIKVAGNKTNKLRKLKEK